MLLPTLLLGLRLTGNGDAAESNQQRRRCRP